MTNERCAEILQSIKFMLSSEQYSDEAEEALDKAIKTMGQPKAKIFKVPDGQDPYNAIGEYISNHITVIEDIIAVIEIDDSIINTLFMVDMDAPGYFIWNTDWYEGEKNVALIDFFPVSEATKPIAQPDFDTDQKINKAYDDGYETGYLQGKYDWSGKKTGSWNFIGNQMFECTECGVCYTQSQFHQMRVRITDSIFPNFCPNCGAQMNDGVEWEI